MQHDFILLDRSGSMGGSMWTEALGSINAYVKKLADDNVETGVTLALFDSNNSFEVIRDRITPKTWKPVSNADGTPRGGTPLNDATAKLIDLAEKGPPWGGQYERVAIVVVTDGEENASQEYRDPNKIRTRLDACRAKGWQVIFLGANFDNQRQAAAYGVALNQTVSSTMANMGSTMSAMATKRSAYGATGQSINWTEDEQTAAKTDTPKAS